MLGTPVPPLYSLDRTVIIVALLAWPLAAYLQCYGVRPVALLIGAVSVSALVAMTSSQAATLGLVLATLIYVMTHRAPSLCGKALRAVVVAGTIMAPLVVLYFVMRRQLRKV